MYHAFIYRTRSYLLRITKQFFRRCVHVHNRVQTDQAFSDQGHLFGVYVWATYFVPFSLILNPIVIFNVTLYFNRLRMVFALRASRFQPPPPPPIKIA